MSRILCKDLCDDCKKEYAQKFNMNYELMKDDQKLDENGFAIFPENKSNLELQQTVDQLTAHLQKMTEQLNLLLQIQNNQK
jgi:hypothetical protein